MTATQTQPQTQVQQTQPQTQQNNNAWDCDKSVLYCDNIVLYFVAMTKPITSKRQTRISYAKRLGLGPTMA